MLHQSGPCKPVPHSLALWHSKVFPGSWRETGGPCPHWNWLVEKVGSVFLPSLRLLPDSLPVWVALPYFTDTPKYAPPVCLFRSAGTTCSWLAKWGILWIFLVYFKKCLAVCQNNMSPTEIPCHPDWRPLWPPRTLQAVFHGEPHVAKKTMTNGTIKHVANELGWSNPSRAGPWRFFFLMEEIRIVKSPGEDGTAPLSTLLGSQVNEIAALLTRLTDAEVPGPG